MMLKSAIVALGGLSALSEATAIKRTPSYRSIEKRAGGSQCLDQNAVQTGSFSTGQVNDVAADGQSNSAT